MLKQGEAGRLTGGGPNLVSALDKVRQGRLFDLLPEERIALKGQATKTALDPKVLTAAIVGATGLGLAMAMSGCLTPHS